MTTIKPEIIKLARQFNKEESYIPHNRMPLLNSMTHQIRKELSDNHSAKLNFICTHNSRRSQIAQIWAYTFSCLFHLTDIETYSGGTEVTSFHPTAVNTMRTLGFNITSENNPSDSQNPKYTVTISDKIKPLICFSKRFENAIPQGMTFLAVMTCSQADRNCPFVPGASTRIPLTFEDPKKYDHSSNFQKEYLITAHEIGRQLYRVFNNIKT